MPPHPTTDSTGDSHPAAEPDGDLDGTIVDDTVDDDLDDTVDDDLDDTVDDDLDDTVDDDLDRARDGRGPDGDDGTRLWTRLDWYVCLGLLAVSLALVGLHNSSYRTLSPIDELQHIDYVIRAGDLDIPRRNERVEFEAMDEAACRSVDAPGYEGPPCGLPEYDPAWFQEKGFNTAASQFPPYYVVTGLSSRGLTAIGVFDSQVTAARTLGAVWAAAAWSVTWYLMAMLGVRRRHRAVVIALLITTPLTLFHGMATVNADVSLMLSGALAVLATMKFEAGRLRWWWLPIIYTGLFFVEATNILAVAACAAYLTVRRGLDASLGWRSRLAPLAILPWLFVLRTEIAGRVQDALFPAARRPVVEGQVEVAPMFVNHRTDGVSVDKVLAQLPSTFTPVWNPYFSPPLRSQLTISAVQLTNWLLIALMFGGAFMLSLRASATWWARIVMVSLLAAGPFYTLYFAYYSNQDFPAPARFALPLVPLMAVVVATAIRTRPTEIAVAVVTAIAAGNTIYQLLTAL